MFTTTGKILKFPSPSSQKIFNVTPLVYIYIFYIIYSRGVRNDPTIQPPIRQTASIFKQPVTIYKTQEGKVKTDFKHGPQEKPKQLFWEKRLEGLRACGLDGLELDPMELPKNLKPVSKASAFPK